MQQKQILLLLIFLLGLNWVMLAITYHRAALDGQLLRKGRTITSDTASPGLFESRVILPR